MERPCTECGKVVTRSASHMRRGKIFCNRGCLSAWRRKHEAGANHSNRKGHTITCAYCGMVSMRSPSLIKSRLSFCDMACRARWLSEQAGEVYKKDDNHDEIVAALRGAGCSVLELHLLGHGVPDLAVGYKGVNYLIEIKNPKTKHGMTKAQLKWHDEWRGQVTVVESTEDAYRAVGLA